MSKVKSYLSLIKFSHTIFAMPFALIGFFIGMDVIFGNANNKVWQWNLSKTIGWENEGILRYSYADDSFIHKFLQSQNPILIVLMYFLLIILCMIFARSAAMAFNRYLDRSFDAKNPRTAIREIPSGIIKANNALLFTIVSSLLFVVCTFFINRICFFLSPVALLVVLGYSYTKRLHHF